ncbi:MAG: DNA-processing protein DprA [Nocardiopsaceae bacterium]|jgi:DNA processing protein|nr:DNA-processing protein DprA [Nocardiopsaceae bacterium]
MTAGQALRLYSDDRYARVVLSILTDPGDEALGALLRYVPPSEIAALVMSQHGDPASVLLGRGSGAGGSGAADSRDGADGGGSAAGTDRADFGGEHRIVGKVAVRRAVERWRLRRQAVPAPTRLAAWEDAGFRIVCPGDAEWPTQLDDLGPVRPVVLWLRGPADLRFSCLRSVSVVGSRTATAYGCHVATELSADLADLGWTIISGGAFGIDAAAHRGALAVDGTTVAVLASGLNFGYPKGNADMFAAIAGNGVLVSECPPDRSPTRPGFLIRNRVIAGLSRGTLVVEAALRSGAINTARHAQELNRPVMAVPGPITSEQSAGCHELIRESATCVTGARDVIELITPLGDAATNAVDEPAVPADGLDPVTASVLRAVAQRTGRGPATIATIARVDLDTALRCLGLLAAAGYVERCDQGWRARKSREGRGKRR